MFKHLLIIELDHCFCFPILQAAIIKAKVIIIIVLLINFQLTFLIQRVTHLHLTIKLYFN